MNSFKSEMTARTRDMHADLPLQNASLEFLRHSARAQYSYNFHWMGRPIIQYPQDVMAMQELIHKVRPDLIIETGIAHGGSLIFSASILALLDMEDAIERRESFDPTISRRKVLGIDIDIRAHNRAAIDAHPMRSRIDMIEGSSTAPEIIDQVHEIAAGYSRVLVCLDSNHTHDHVLKELHAYAPLVSEGSYCVVFDTLIEDMPDDTYPDRPWGKGNNPHTAVQTFLNSARPFEVDTQIHERLLITVARNGFLRRKTA